MSEESTPVSNNFLRQPSSRKAYYILPVGILLLLVAALLFIYRVDGDRLLSRIAAHWALREDTLQILQENGRERVHTFGILGPKPITPSQNISSYDAVNGVSAEIRVTDSAEEVWIASPDAVLISGGSSYKDTVAISADGTYLAYATAPEGSVRDRLSSWAIVIYNRASGTSTRLGEGYAPQFFAQNGMTYLLFTNSDGIAVADVSTATVYVTPLRFPDATAFAAQIAVDGKYLAYRDSARRVWNLYAVESATPEYPLALRPLPTDISALSSARFSDSMLLGILPQWEEFDDRREMLSQDLVNVDLTSGEQKSLYGISPALSVMLK